MRIVFEHPMTTDLGLDRGQVVHALAEVRQWFVEREEITSEGSMIVPKVGFAEMMVRLAQAFKLSPLEAACAFGPHLTEELIWGELFKQHGDALAAENVDQIEAPFNLGAMNGCWPA